MMKKFKWKDTLVCEFARVSSGGSYGPYQGCITVESKLKRFKELKMNEGKKIEVSMRDKVFLVTESPPESVSFVDFAKAIYQGNELTGATEPEDIPEKIRSKRDAINYLETYTELNLIGKDDATYTGGGEVRAEGVFADGSRYVKYHENLDEAMDRVAEYSDEELNKESIYYYDEGGEFVREIESVKNIDDEVIWRKNSSWSCRKETLAEVIDFLKEGHWDSFILYDDTTPEEKPMYSTRVGIKIRV